MTLASRTNCLLGQFLDTLAGVAPVLLGVAAFAVSDKFGALVYLIAILWALCYYFLADCMPNGQSFAKQWLGTRVVDRLTGKPCTCGQSFVRNLFLFFLGPIDWVFIFGERNQRLGDKVAGTIVIEV